MRFERTRATVAILISVLVGASPTLHTVAALAQTPSAEQLKTFQNLPQAQRDAILQQLGGDRSTTTPPQQNSTSNQIVVQRPDVTPPDSEPQEIDPRTGLAREPTIKGNEQLLIELVLPLPSTGRSPSDLAGRQSGDSFGRNGIDSSPRSTGDPFVRPGGDLVARSTGDALARLNGEIPPRSPAEQRALEDRRDEILKRNPFELTDRGVLQLPGFAPIHLAGLTRKEIQERLALDPLLRDFAVSVTVLRLEAQGTRALKPFGYEMFRAGATAWVPGTDIPVPSDYKLAAGDVMGVQLYGQKSQTYTLPVGRDGTISFPELGPIAVGGLGFGTAQSALEKRVRDQMIGTQARVSLTDLRSMRVLVLGDAQKPGTYVVSGLSTVTNTLFSSGGVKPIGSLRNIEVKRDGKLLRRLDLYEVLLRGDTSGDVRLQTGDVVFVPPVGATVGIDGEIHRPAIYELARERSLAELIALAGGLSPDADPTAASVERVGNNGAREAVRVDLASPAGRAFQLKSGDVVHIASVRPLVENGIELDGQVYRPGSYAWREGLRLSDVLRSMDDLKPGADPHYVLVRREAPDTKRVSAVSADLGAALAKPGSGLDIPLNARDRITVFDTISPRERVVKPLLDEVLRQSRPEDPAGLVAVEGVVNAPGIYPLEPGMRVSDLLRAGGGLQDSAYVVSAELDRYRVVDGQKRKSEVVQVDLPALRAGDQTADTLLSPYDTLSVRTTPEWGRMERMEIVGEVRFPGIYVVRRGETLRSIVERAGGLTSLAFPAGAVFTREDLKAREREQLDRLASRLESDLTATSIQASRQVSLTNQGPQQALAAGQGLLDQLRHAKPVGRLVIDLSTVLAGNTAAESDLEVRNGDRLIVPRAIQEVSVLGEVQNPTSHLYRRGLTRNDVIALSGGVTAHADKARAYVVRADGSVVASGSGWFKGGDVALKPGDTVVVPTDTEKMPPLPMWTAVTTIIYNLAIAATAIARL